MNIKKPLLISLFFLLVFNFQCIISGGSNGSSTTTTSTRISPTISSITVGSVTPTTMSVTVSASDSSGLSEIDVFLTDSSGYTWSPSSFISNVTYVSVSGTSATTTLTVTHTAPVGTVLYPDVRVWDTSLHEDKYKYNSLYSTVNFSEYNADTYTYSDSGYPLVWGTVPAAPAAPQLNAAFTYCTSTIVNPAVTWLATDSITCYLYSDITMGYAEVDAQDAFNNYYNFSSATPNGTYQVLTTTMNYTNTFWNSNQMVYPQIVLCTDSTWNNCNIYTYNSIYGLNYYQNHYDFGTATITPVGGTSIPISFF